MPRYSVQLDDDLTRKLKKMAKSEDRTIASMLRCIVARVLNNTHVGKSASLQRQNSANQRHFSAETAPLRQSPGPARASTERILNKRSLSSKEVARPEHGFDAFTAELQGILNAAGCRHNLHDQAAARAVYDRMNPTSPALGDPASEDQIREMVTGAASQWGGTQYAAGLDLLGLLDQRFWTRLGKMGAASRGKAQASASLASRREESERSSEAAAQRRADESKARWRAEQASKAASAEGLSPELKTIADRVAAREASDE